MPVRCFWTFLLTTLSYLNSNVQTIPSSTGSNQKQAEAVLVLKYHNIYREEVCVEALTWSASLASYAQEWADYLVKDNCSFHHRKGESRKELYGENTFEGRRTIFTQANAASAWYAEKEYFKPGVFTDEIEFNTGYYTQMV